MLDLLIYHLHLVAIVYAFTRRWQAEGLKSGVLAVVLIGLAFTILWAMMGPLARFIMPQPSLPGDVFTSDTLSLLLTSAAETPLFITFFLRRFGQNPQPS
jgi:hypothetical protein